jgi:hypothetical protein
MVRHRQKCHSVATRRLPTREGDLATTGTAESGLYSVGKTGAEI